MFTVIIKLNLITNDNIMKLTYTMPIVQLNDEHNDKGEIMTMIIITMTKKKKTRSFKL